MQAPDYRQLSERIKLLAHPERLRILDVLRHEPECVCHLEALLGKPQPYVSQQLRLLREAGLIVDEKDGLNVFYRLVDHQVLAWLDAVLAPIADEYPELGHHTKVMTCACPKCDSSIEPAALAPSLTSG